MKKGIRCTTRCFLLPIFLILSLMGSFIFYNPPTNEVLVISEKIGEQKLKIKKIDLTTYAIKSLDDNIVQIGTEKHSPPQPYLILNKWDDEVSLKVTMPYITEEKPIVEGNKIRYSTITTQNSQNASWWQKIFDKSLVYAQLDQPKVDIEFYPRESEEVTEVINGETHTFTQDEQGGVEFDTILYKKPETNKIIFPIEAKGLKFYYQPPLHPEHPTWADEDGDGIADSFRLESVVGSYAVYHESKSGDYTALGGKNYMAGKAFHIYRPKVTDANGNEIWGQLTINNQQLIITIDQNWLNNAVYPVSIDPNFGYETIGGTYATDIAKDNITGSHFLGVSGTASSITVYGYFWTDGDIEKVKNALYKQSDNSFVEGVIEATWDPDNWHWQTFNFSTGPDITAINYWIVAWSDGTNATMKYDTGDSGQGGSDAETYNNWPTTLNPSTNDRKYSIYCTYSLSKGINVSATVQEWLTFTSSTTSVELLPDLVDTTGGTHIASSTDFKLTVGTNSADGYSITVADSNSGIKDNGNTIQLTGATNTIAAGTDGYGIQATSSDMTIQALYKWSTSTEVVGRVSSTAAKMASDNSPGTGQGAWVKIKAACDSTQPSGTYTDVITFTAVPTP